MYKSEKLKQIGNIESECFDVVVKVNRGNDGWVYVICEKDEDCVTPEEYDEICKDYCMIKMTKGTKVKRIVGEKGIALFIWN